LSDEKGSFGCPFSFLDTKHGGLPHFPTGLSVTANKWGNHHVQNKIKLAWAAGKAVVNGWLAIPSGFSAEVMAQCGFDSVTVDLQHGVQDYQSMVQCFQAMQAHPVLPMVRVPWNEPGIVGKVLDAGAYGLICPMINTVEEAEKLVSYAKYPPEGARSNGPIRAAMYGESTNYQKTANDEIIILPMIETKQAVENLEAILDVPGISGVYIGPSDLGFSYGLIPILDREEPLILDIYARVIAECTKRGLYAGVHCGSAAYAARAIKMGFRLVTISNDSGLMAVAAKSAVKQVHAEAAAHI
jgi:4-hydroxy-2-oxoheptanedioate aldolase